MSKIWFVKKKISDWYYDVKNGVPNLIKWFPVIWKNRDWDHSFIWLILHKKLTLMEYCIRNYGHHVYNKRDADQIKLCINLLDRLIKDDYHDNVFKYHDQKWGQLHLRFIDIKDNPEISRVNITRPKIITIEDKKQERKEFRRLSEKVEKQRKQDIYFLFDYMKKHIQGWWD
jgi:hypothetical protein